MEGWGDGLPACSVESVSSNESWPASSNFALLRPCSLVLFPYVQGVGKEIQLSLGYDFRIKLSQGSGGSVAGVGKAGFFSGFPFLVNALKDIQGQKSFAAHFDSGRGDS
jgi:hypothetical protein